LSSSAALTLEHLRTIDREAWGEKISLMIHMLHKITPSRGRHENLVEARRKADWVNVSFNTLVFGLDRKWLREVRARLPLHTFHLRALFPVIGVSMVKHPLTPMPNFHL
jgi:hypothetical protein